MQHIAFIILRFKMKSEMGKIQLFGVVRRMHVLSCGTLYQGTVV